MTQLFVPPPILFSVRCRMRQDSNINPASRPDLSRFYGSPASQPRYVTWFERLRPARYCRTYEDIGGKKLGLAKIPILQTSHLADEKKLHL
jgi:hypothetical protein